jgi:ribosomal 50S subunit-recycling heat shock protein
MAGGSRKFRRKFVPEASSRCRFTIASEILRVVALPARRRPASEARACYEELTQGNPRPSEAG